MSRFAPRPGETIELLGARYSFVTHPGNPRAVYAVEASRATVYQLALGSSRYALKVFKQRFRVQALVATTERLCAVRDLPGLAAAKRWIIVDPPDEQQDLRYAVLIPWMTGKTWSDLLLSARAGQRPPLDVAAALCDRFLEVVAGLQSRNFAHTDLSAANVMFDRAGNDVQLIDLEDLFQPGATEPSAPSRGSRGYQHPSGETCWTVDGDRYSSSVLAAEILLATDRDAVEVASEENLFGMRAADDVRHRMLLRRLEFIAPPFAAVFRRAWNSTRLADCPDAEELRAALQPLRKQLAAGVQWTTRVLASSKPTPKPALPPIVPIIPPESGSVDESSTFAPVWRAIVILLVLYFLLRACSAHSEPRHDTPKVRAHINESISGNS